MTMPAPARPEEPYVSLDQQHHADKLGMFVFLATEIMLFGGVFAAIFYLRLTHSEAFVAASRALHVWIGAANTAVLLSSSFAVALAVAFAREGAARHARNCLLAAVALGLAFLGLKAWEYASEYGEGLLPLNPASDLSDLHQLFMNVYLIATGLHAIHVTIGIGLLGFLVMGLGRGHLSLPRRAIVIEIGGLYWHLVDAIWVLLYPVLYLAR